MTAPSSALIERAGGPAGLRALLVDFYERVFADRMIGFFFKGADQDRLVEKELELALRFLGADVPYTGLPLRELHARHPIQGGQFMRRLQLLKETLRDHGAPEDVCEAWVRHTLELRPEITTDALDECDPRGKPGHPG